MANVVFFMFPETGHINSSLKIAKTLKSCGHHVFYLQIPEFKEYICSQGLEFIPLFERIFPTGYRFAQNLSTVENLLLRIKMEADALGMSTLTLLKNELVDKVERIKPHLFVQDIYIVNPGPLEIGVPCISLNPTIVPRTAHINPEVQILTLCPKDFDLPHTERTTQEHYVEASIDIHRKEPKFPWGQIHGDKRLIYCSLGTQGHLSSGNASHELTQHIRKHFLQTIINAMIDNPKWQLILSIGNYMRAEDFHSVPSNVLLFNTVPQIKILERASLMITAGGLNSVKECIFFGVPMIVFPFANDQYKNADCIVFHQLGLKGDIENVSEGLINSLIDEITSNPLYGHKIEKMKRIFRRAENSGRAITILESALMSEP